MSSETRPPQQAYRPPDPGSGADERSVGELFSAVSEDISTLMRQ